MIGYNIRIRESIKKYRGKKHPVDLIGYKLKGYALADKLGIKHAKVIGIFNQIEDVNWEELPDEFVIHPQCGCGTRGVLPLLHKDGKYENLFLNAFMTKEEIMMHFKEGICQLPPNRYSQNLWIEELISNPIPCDWKIFTFNGRIGAIRQYIRNSNPKYTKCWTKDWENNNRNLSDSYLHNKIYKVDDNLPEPLNKEELIKVAEILSKEIKYPFVRIDLYDTKKGVYIGEFTPHPGCEKVYGEALDIEMGKLWMLAEKELNYE